MQSCIHVCMQQLGRRSAAVLQAPMLILYCQMRLQQLTVGAETLCAQSTTPADLSGFLYGLCRPCFGHDCRLCTKGSISSTCVSGSRTNDSPLRGSGSVLVRALLVQRPATAGQGKCDQRVAVETDCYLVHPSMQTHLRPQCRCTATICTHPGFVLLLAVSRSSCLGLQWPTSRGCDRQHKQLCLI